MKTGPDENKALSGPRGGGNPQIDDKMAANSEYRKILNGLTPEKICAASGIPADVMANAMKRIEHK